MNIAIIEDEAPALSRIKKLIAEVATDANIVFTADSIESAVRSFNTHSTIDLALFDIELADGQSFEVFKQVNVKCPIIFTTAYDEFALKAFKLNSIDYLLKPIEKTELAAAINKFKTMHKHQPDYAAQLQSLMASFKPQLSTYKSRFLIKTGTKLLSISVDDIAYFHAADKVVYVCTFAEQKYIIDHSLDELIQILNPVNFFQINRQFIANIKSIKSVHTYFNSKLKVDLTPSLSEEVLISREKAGEFKNWLNA